MNTEELNIIDQAKHGDEKAFNQLYNRYCKLIRYIIFDIVKDDIITQDLVSVTFTKAFSKLDFYRNPISFEAWLKTIAVNTTIDYLRHTKDEDKNYSIDDEDNTLQLTEMSPDPESDMIKTEDIEQLKVALSRLRSKYRNILELRYYQGLSYKELSAKLDIPVGTIKSDLSKAKRKLRELFHKLSN